MVNTTFGVTTIHDAWILTFAFMADSWPPDHAVQLPHNMVQYSISIRHARYPSDLHTSWTVAHARVLLPHHARDAVLLVGPNDHRNAFAGGSSRSFWRHGMFEEIVKGPQWSKPGTCGLVVSAFWVDPDLEPSDRWVQQMTACRGDLPRADSSSHQIPLSCSSKAKMSPFSVTTCREVKPFRSHSFGRCRAEHCKPHVMLACLVNT